MATLGQDILTTAVEGGIGYWFQITDCKRTPDLDWVEVTGRQLNDDESDFDGPEHTIKASQLERAARELIATEQVNSTIRGTIRSMLGERDAGYIDCGDADCIFQFAALGSVVFG